MKTATLPAAPFLSRLFLKAPRAAVPVDPKERRHIFDAITAAGACNSEESALTMMSTISDHL